jgi:hypothetical protein
MPAYQPASPASGRALWLVSLAAAASLVSAAAQAVEIVSLARHGKTEVVEGRVLTEAKDGGLMLQSADGTIWMIQPEEIQSRGSDDRPFQPLTQKQMSERLLQEFPEGFRIHTTAHYIICYNTTPTYAQWCAGLYERLYRGFLNYWKTRGLELQDPEFPLVALVFDSRENFAAYARPELGSAVDGVIGYYNMRTNRVNMYDLTGADELKRIAPRISSLAHINQLLSQPGAERTVATIVHEATHQLAFNCGLQVRFADNPMWVSEGLAVYFESPDFKSDRGWKTIGVVNRLHLLNFGRYLGQRPQESLLSLLADDSRFLDGGQTGNAYSEAWALNYYLLNRQRDKYVTYLKRLSEQPPLVAQGPEQRLEMFTEVFGDLAELDQDFVRFFARLR